MYKHTLDSPPTSAQKIMVMRHYDVIGDSARCSPVTATVLVITSLLIVLLYEQLLIWMLTRCLCKQPSGRVRYGRFSYSLNLLSSCSKVIIPDRPTSCVCISRGSVDTPTPATIHVYHQQTFIFFNFINIFNAVDKIVCIYIFCPIRSQIIPCVYVLSLHELAANMTGSHAHVIVTWRVSGVTYSHSKLFGINRNSRVQVSFGIGFCLLSIQSQFIGAHTIQPQAQIRCYVTV